MKRNWRAAMGRMDGKVAIVTGGSLGIGRASCLRLAREKAKVAITDVLDREGEELAKTIGAEGGQAGFWHLDVTDRQSVADTFEAIRQRFGRIDVLVNNAGIGGVNKPTHELSETEWDQVMAVNVKGVFLCTKYAVPYLVEAGGGSIINLSSIYGIVGAPDNPPYHASKGAVRLMSKTDALLYAKDRIRVNSVHPGFIWTPMVEEAARNSPQGLEAFKNYLVGQHPIGFLGDADDVAHGILYLASEESRFVTGSELVIDGGYTAR